jgi:two-component system OmpR family response regulator
MPPMPQHVLIVEDDESIRTLVEVVAQRSGYLTSTVNHGGDAIMALKAPDRDKYCVVVLDLMMPHVSGYDVILHIKENQLSIPVVVMTAAVKTLQRDKLDPSIVRAIVTKPFDLDKLRAAIAQACEGFEGAGLSAVKQA